MHVHHSTPLAVGIEPDHKTIDVVTRLIASLQDSVNELIAIKDKHNFKNVEDHMNFVRDSILPKMLEIRSYVDDLEAYVADDLWPLPTYQEMLFIK